MLDIDASVGEPVQCKQCGETYPHNRRNFRRNGDGKISNVCKTCHKKNVADRKAAYESSTNKEPLKNRQILMGHCFSCKKPLTRRRREAGVCKECFKLVGGSKIGNGCQTCKYHIMCKERIRNNVWVICENPTIEDIVSLVSQGVESSVIGSLERNYSIKIDAEHPSLSLIRG